MPRLVFKGDIDAEDYPEDVTFIQQMIETRGFKIRRHDVEAAWRAYSDTMSASWMTVQGRDWENIWAAVSPFLRET